MARNLRKDTTLLYDELRNYLSEIHTVFNLHEWELTFVTTKNNFADFLTSSEHVVTQVILVVTENNWELIVELAKMAYEKRAAVIILRTNRCAFIDKKNTRRWNSGDVFSYCTHLPAVARNF